MKLTPNSWISGTNVFHVNDSQQIRWILASLAIGNAGWPPTRSITSVLGQYGSWDTAARTTLVQRPAL